MADKEQMKLQFYWKFFNFPISKTPYLSHFICA